MPEGWPQPVYPIHTNPVTEAGFQLGRALFYDPILSRDTTISCASCHLQATGFAHVDHNLSHGIKDRIGARNALPIMNMAWSTSFMWDGGVRHLDMQPLNPISSPTEMDESLAHVVQKLNASPKYRRLFKEAFGDATVTGQHMLLAMSQFVLMLQSYNARYDQYMRHEIEFSAQELKGLALFRQHCAACHTEPLFTNQGFANNGLPMDTALRDLGRFNITQLPADSFAFKVPTLRNIQFTYPYMHDGRFKQLSSVIKHYTNGIPDRSRVSKPLQDPIIMSAEEQVDLVAFLLTLTDRNFLFDPRYGFPRG